MVLSEGKVGKHQGREYCQEVREGQKEAGSQNRPMMCSCENGSSGVNRKLVDLCSDCGLSLVSLASLCLGSHEL